MPEGFDPATANGHDMRLFRRAMRNGWPIPDELRAKAMQRLDTMLDSKDERCVIQAIKTLVTADAVNQRRERDEQDAQVEAVKYQLVVVEEIVDAPRRAIAGEAGAAQEKHPPA